MKDVLQSNIVIAPVGTKDSTHKEWIKGKREFNLMLVNYSDIPGLYREDADFYYETKGLKFKILKEAIEANRILIDKYSFIWLPDDDLSIATDSINRLFRIFKEYSLDFGQPSVRHGQCVHSITRWRPHCVLRYTNFIELMCPLFSRDALWQVLDTFGINYSGWGIDWIWSDRLRSMHGAIVDEVSVIHTKSLFSGEYYKKLSALGVSIGREFQDAKDRYHFSMKYEEYGRVYKFWPNFFTHFDRQHKVDKIYLKLQSLWEWFCGKLRKKISADNC